MESSVPRSKTVPKGLAQGHCNGPEDFHSTGVRAKVIYKTSWHSNQLLTVCSDGDEDESGHDESDESSSGDIETPQPLGFDTVGTSHSNLVPDLTCHSKLTMRPKAQ